MWSGAARSTPINDKTDRKKPSAWRKGSRKTRRSVNAVSIAQSENVFGAPGRPDGDGRHASVASAESHSVTSPRWTKACSYADQFPTRYFVLYFGWTFDLMSRSCTRSGHRGQRAYSCLVAAEGLCTNASDHVHVLLGIPPKVSVANTVGFLKGKSAIRIHREYLGRQRNFTGYHLWARGYCVSTVGVAEEVIRDYIRKQEADEKKQEKLELG